MSFIGASFSMHPNAYEQYKETKDGEIFEKLISDIILNKYSDDQNLTEFILSLPKEKQRLAVLSLIDKERKGDVNHLWSEMVSYVRDNVSKMEHIKNVVKIINQFVKDGEVEKKKHGEVMTPITLVREMLDTLPKEVWSNPNLKWLDPANGAGTFPFVIIYKLMNGLSEWEPNEEKRYKHIVESMIYTCELQSRNVFLWLCGVDPKDEYTTNAYWGSFLDEGFDRHMKDVWDVDKFDIVVGNPPYNSELDYEKGSAIPLYNHFTEKSIIISQRILFITPSRWFAGGKGLDSFRKKMLSSNKISIIKHYENTNSIFTNVEIKGGVSYFIYDKDFDGLCSFNGNKLKLNTYDIIPTDVSKGAFLLIDRFKDRKNIDSICRGQSYAGITSNDNRLVDIKHNDDYLICYVSKQKGLKKFISKNSLKNIEDIDKYKVFTSRTYGAGPAFNKSFYIGDKYEVCNQSYITFLVDSYNEAISLKSYLSTRFSNKILSLRKISQDIKPDTCKWIPMVPFDREWTDELLFEYFNLSEDEKKIILT